MLSDMKTEKPSRRLVLVVERDPRLRAALAEMLVDAIPHVAVCEAASTEEAMELLTSERPALAIVEVGGDGENAFATVRHLRAVHPELPILALGHPHELPYADCAAAEGALGYLRKSDPPEQLVRAARIVIQTFEAS
jgi:DNA-binding NarL/FixJ family response regulator